MPRRYHFAGGSISALNDEECRERLLAGVCSRLKYKGLDLPVDLWLIVGFGNHGNAANTVVPHATTARSSAKVRQSLNTEPFGPSESVWKAVLRVG